MTITHLIFDVDGVLLDWGRGFMNFMMKHEHPPRSIFYRQWNMACCWPNLDIGPFIQEFNRSFDYALLDIIPGARHGLAELADRFPCATRVAVTACGLDSMTLQRRTRALEDWPLDEIHPVAVGASKRKTYEQFPAATSIVFEDHDKHADEALRLGMRVVLFDYPHNASYAPPRECNSALLFRAEGWGHALEECRWLKIPEFPKT